MADLTHFIRLTGGPYPVNALPFEPGEKIGWPPPERLVVLGVLGTLQAICDYDKFPEDERDNAVVYRRVRYSQLTDEEALAATHVARGGEYELDSDPMAEEKNG